MQLASIDMEDPGLVTAADEEAKEEAKTEEVTAAPVLETAHRELTDADLELD